MTPLNTIIEEIMNEWCDKYGHFLAFESDALTDLTTAMQRAYEAGRKDWLRSEIEKLEGMKGKEYDYSSIDAFNEVRTEAWDEALTSIITRYKEELKVLEGKEI